MKVAVATRIASQVLLNTDGRLIVTPTLAMFHKDPSTSHYGGVDELSLPRHHKINGCEYSIAVSLLA